MAQVKATSCGEVGIRVRVCNTKSLSCRQTPINHCPASVSQVTGVLRTEYAPWRSGLGKDRSGKGGGPLLG